MKKLFLLALLAVASTTGAFAQARAGGEITSKDYTGGGVTSSRNTGFGLKGGYNYSNVYGDGAKAFDFKGYNAFHAGAYGQIGFNNFASMQFELLYTRKGFDSNSSGTGVTFNGGRRLDYLQVPVMFVGNVTETLSFHLGPQISLLTKVLENGNDVGIATSGYNSVDYGAVGGVEARVGPARIGARYDLGLGKLHDTNSAAVATQSTTVKISDRVTNGTLQLYVGIGFTQ